jgi:acetoin utilization deacetylase AcuC-like enzyme
MPAADIPEKERRPVSVRWFHAPHYDYGAGLPGIPDEVHGFVLNKPTRIRAGLMEAGAVRVDAFEEPAAVTEADLARVHAPRLIRALHDARAVAAAIELPELAEMPSELVWQVVVAPQLLAAGGSYLALRAAAVDGAWAFNLSGGYHHARRDLSHGFCLINDVAVAVARLRAEGVRRRILIVDLDLHQGDGNATCFADDAEVFTVSVHEEAIFPVPKARSNLDVGLASYAGDDDYLAAVDGSLREARARFAPELIAYVAGSDPYTADPLGTLQVSRAGLLARDRRVAALARELGCPLVALPAGGYSPESAAITAAGFAAMAALAG